MEQPKELSVSGVPYAVKKLLGKGKGGYSYLVTDGTGEYVLKQIHHEPCAYYQFGDKMAAELNDYRRLRETGIRMPRLLAADREAERILKEYIAGDTIFDYVRRDRMRPEFLDQVREMSRLLAPAGLNIDYFPTNFVVRDGLLYYIDYECNDYQEQWDFEHWGIAYWSRTPEFLQHLAENPALSSPS